VRERAGDARGAAEACESLARTSTVPDHQLLAWYDAGTIWLDQVKDEERGLIALEQAAAIDVSYSDTFQRLSARYAARKSPGELASLLERRIAKVKEPGERITLLVEQGRVLTDVEDYKGARAAFEAALEAKPDDPGALSALADLCARERDWSAAEQAWVRLARLLPTPDEQRVVYARLGELYAKHAVNLARAEVALKEVLKRAPGDIPTMEQLVDVFKRENDSARAIELQQELLAKATTPEDRRKRLIEMSVIYESTGHDNRKAEQALETARREMPTDGTVLRALVEFYTRHKQMPAVNILLDRVSGDARRAFGAGRFVPAMFEVLSTVYDLRGKKDASKVVSATLAAFEGRATEIRGVDARGLDPRLDDALAPEMLTPAFRALLARTGEALDAAAPPDLKAMRATQLPPSAGAIGALVSNLAAAMGIGGVNVLVSPQVGLGVVPGGTTPPTIIVGEGLVASDKVDAQRFLIARALKLVQARASALVRLPTGDLAVLIGAWLQVFNPTWKPQGVNPAALADRGKRIQAALPKNLGPDIAMMAMEIAGTLGTSAAMFGTATMQWGNRAALLAVGDPSAALDAIAMSQGQARGAPRDAKERATWIGRAPEAKDIIQFSVNDAYGELRSRTGAT
jgi:tetratricopeptide (TPR) repeat protein